MNVVLLLIIILGTVVQTVTRKEYNKKVQGGTFTFSAASIIFALLFFVISSKGRFEADKATCLYAVIFAVAYSVGTVTCFLAIQTGPLSLTALLSSYSLIIPTLYGLTVLDEPVTAFLIAGILLLLVSVIFVNIEKKGEPRKITFKWIIYVLFMFIGNGSCSTIQKMQQISSNGLYKNEFMIIALMISGAAIMITAVIFERKEILHNLKKGILTYSLCGIGNGVVNLLVMVLSASMAASIMFPVISAGGIVVTTVISLLVYKERLTGYQKFGVLLGTLSIIFLNI